MAIMHGVHETVEVHLMISILVDDSSGPIRSSSMDNGGCISLMVYSKHLLCVVA